MKIKENFSTLSHLNYYRVIHGIKTAVACLIGLAIEKYFNWPSGQWVPITIMVVMSAQTHFGGAVCKSLMRFLGTISGVATTIAALWFFGDNPVVIFSTVFFACTIFTYIASSHGDISYAGTLGGVTVILILSGQQIGIDIALQRGFYITVGIIIALFASRFIFPIHARDRLRYHMTITLRNLSKLYLATIQLEENPSLNSRIADDIATQPRLIYEAVVGSREFAAKKAIFNAMLGSEQCFHRLINLIYLSLHETTSFTTVKTQLAAIEGVHKIISENFDHLADCLETRTTPHKIETLAAALVLITKAAEGLAKEEEMHQLIIEHSFLFFIEQLLKELEALRKLIEKANSKN